MKSMKKILALLLALSMVLALAACGNASPAASSGDGAAPVSTKHVKIGVGLYQDSGAGVTAV